jgi:WD40 repeat protein
VRVRPSPILIRSIAFASSGRTLAAAGADPHIFLVDTVTRRITRTVLHQDTDLECVAWSPDGRLFAAGGSDGNIQIWDARGQLTHVLCGPEPYLTALAFSPDRESLAACHGLTWTYTITVWNYADGRIKHQIRLSGDQSGSRALAISPDGQLLASTREPSEGGGRCAVALWDLKSGECVREVATHRIGVLGICFTADGRSVVSLGYDNQVAASGIGGVSAPEVLYSGEAVATAIAAHPSLAVVAIVLGDRHDGSRHRELLLVNVESRERITRPLAEKCSVSSVAFSPDGDTIATNSYRNIVNLCDVSREVARLSNTAAGSLQQRAENPVRRGRDANGQ